MGRKRLENKKKKLTLTVDEEIITKLRKMKVNKSLLFTDVAKELIFENENEKNK